MIIVMKRFAPKEHIEHIINELESQKLKPVPLYGTERTVIAVIGDERLLDINHLRALPSVSNVMPVLKPYKLAARETKNEDTVIDINGIKIGGKELSIMAGPCSIESQEQMSLTARAVSRSGAKILRGGAFKPRTTPYSFQGHEEKGLKMIRKAALLKRGLCATLKEFLLAAEYILAGGNQKVILCERGIRTYEDDMRNTLSIGAVARIKELSHLPLIVDPSHATGIASLVCPVALAAVAAGADGLMIEVHPNPAEALTDGDQSITPEAFDNMMAKLNLVAVAVDKELPKQRK